MRRWTVFFLPGMYPELVYFTTCYQDKQPSAKNSLPIKEHMKLPILAENVKWMKTTLGVEGMHFLSPIHDFIWSIFWLVTARDKLQTEMILKHKVSYQMLERKRRMLKPPGILTFWHKFFSFTNAATYSLSHPNCTLWGPSSTYTSSNCCQYILPRQLHHPHNTWPGLSTWSDPLASLSEIVHTVF